MQPHPKKCAIEFAREALFAEPKTIYKAKRFGGSKVSGLGKLLAAADDEEKGNKEPPGDYSLTVSKDNLGEVAYQRALYSHTEPQLLELCGKNGTIEITWSDMELPVIFNGAARRPSVDLIGYAKELGHFLCELKYSNPKSKSLPASNLADYAIFEGLIYFGIVKKAFSSLDKVGILHRNGRRRFLWSNVAESRRVLVLANDQFWTQAKKKPHQDRILKLCEQIKSDCNVDMMLYETREKGPLSSKNPPDSAGRVLPAFGREQSLTFYPVFPSGDGAAAAAS